jgi:hypothetical protein
MAGEIAFNCQLTLNNGALKDQVRILKTLIDQGVQKRFSDVVTVGTTEQTLVPGDLATFGIAVFQNLDPTNYVDIGITTGVYFNQLEPIASDIPLILRLKPGITIYLKANTAPCRVNVLILND